MTVQFTKIPRIKKMALSAILRDCHFGIYPAAAIALFAKGRQGMTRKKRKLDPALVEAANERFIRSAIVIANFAKSRREQLNLRQEDVGDRLGVSQQQVQRWEQGKQAIPAPRVAAYCKILKTNPNDFFGWGSRNGDKSK